MEQLIQRSSKARFSGPLNAIGVCVGGFQNYGLIYKVTDENDGPFSHLVLVT